MKHMKIGILGDTHGNQAGIAAAMKHFTDVDYILHTGDHHDDIGYILQSYGIKVLGVRGNCDWTGATEVIKSFGGKRILLCHGHQYNVKYSLNGIYYKGQEEEADIVVFGHTHVPLYIVENDMILFNPGSTSFPRGGSKRSCGIIEFGKTMLVKHITLE